MIGTTPCSIWARCSVSNKNNPGISRGLSVKKLCSLTSSRKHNYNIFLFFVWWLRPTLSNIRPRCLVSKKHNPRITRGLNVPKPGFFDIFLLDDILPHQLMSILDYILFLIIGSIFVKKGKMLHEHILFVDLWFLALLFW